MYDMPDFPNLVLDEMNVPEMPELPEFLQNSYINFRMNRMTRETREEIISIIRYAITIEKYVTYNQKLLNDINVL